MGRWNITMNLPGCICGSLMPNSLAMESVSRWGPNGRGRKPSLNALLRYLSSSARICLAINLPALARRCTWCFATNSMDVTHERLAYDGCYHTCAASPLAPGADLSPAGAGPGAAVAPNLDRTAQRCLATTVPDGRSRQAGAAAGRPVPPAATRHACSMDLALCLAQPATLSGPGRRLEPPDLGRCAAAVAAGRAARLALAARHQCHSLAHLGPGAGLPLPAPDARRSPNGRCPRPGAPVGEQRGIRPGRMRGPAGHFTPAPAQSDSDRPGAQRRHLRGGVGRDVCHPPQTRRRVRPTHVPALSARHSSAQTAVQVAVRLSGLAGGVVRHVAGVNQPLGRLSGGRGLAAPDEPPLWPAHAA